MCFAGGCNRLFEGGPLHSWERSCLIRGDGLGRGLGKRNKMISISVTFLLSFDTAINLICILDLFSKQIETSKKQDKCTESKTMTNCVQKMSLELISFSFANDFLVSN